MLDGVGAEALYAIISKFFKGGWRIAPFVIKPNGYIGVKQWAQRAAKSHSELEALAAELRGDIIFGVVPGAGMYIVDLDLKSGKDGLSHWNKRLQEVFPLGDAPSPAIVVKSKSGGYHLYYSSGNNVKLPSPTQIYGPDSGVDIRGYTGMVVMPTCIVGGESDWHPGMYAMVKGQPDSQLTVLPYNLAVPKSKIIDNSDYELGQIRNALTNKEFPPHERAKALTDLVILQSHRDSTLYSAAKMCRRFGLSLDDAYTFMAEVAMHCELAGDETTEHWVTISRDKVRRAYEGELAINSVGDFYNELEYAGIVRCALESGSMYFFQRGSPLLNIEPKSLYTSMGLADKLRGYAVSVTDQGKIIYADKAIQTFYPKTQVQSYGMYPKKDMQFFTSSEGKLCINTFEPCFEEFQPDDALQKKARTEFLPLFRDFVYFVAGNPEDGEYLMQKFAWIIQKPYIKPVTANVIYSQTRGIGKDSLLDLIGQLFTSKYYIKLEEADFDQGFSVYHERIIAVFSEVQLAPGGMARREILKLTGRIKQIITTREMTINEKFKPQRKVESFTNFFILSNYSLGSIMEPGERRIDVFHGTEEKVDQRKYGGLLDIANRQNRADPTKCDAATRLYWDNVLWCLHNFLMNYEIEFDFRRQEARMNDAKRQLLDNFAGEPVTWLRDHLPRVFTKEMVQWLASMCPFRLDPQYAFGNLQESYGSSLVPMQNINATSAANRAFTLHGAPKLVVRDDNGRKMFTLMPDKNFKSQLYTFDVESTALHDAKFISGLIQAWIKERATEYYGGLQVPTLPKNNVLD